MYEQYERSLRFFPFWDRNDTNQITGLINLIEYIFDINPNASEWVEIGSYNGESSSIMLGFKKIKHLHCIDSWTFCANYNQSCVPNKNPDKSADFSYAKNNFYNRLKNKIESKRCIPIQSDSISASNDFLDLSIDVVYVDADHSYESVKSDLNIWYPKIKHGGFICGHDYNIGRDHWPGVTRAVNEFISNNRLKNPILFEDSSYVIQKI
jgi:hypothetical protein